MLQIDKWIFDDLNIFSRLYLLFREIPKWDKLRLLLLRYLRKSMNALLLAAKCKMALGIRVSQHLIGHWLLDRRHVPLTGLLAFGWVC